MYVCNINCYNCAIHVNLYRIMLLSCDIKEGEWEVVS